MIAGLDKLFDVHADAISLRARRSELLASNIANADTPNYKAKDIDFKSVLNNVGVDQRISIKRTDQRHIDHGADKFQVKTQYRIPQQSSLDGNTVDSHVEKSLFMENSVRYQISLNFLSGKIKSFISAIRMDN